MAPLRSINSLSLGLLDFSFLWIFKQEAMERKMSKTFNYCSSYYSPYSVLMFSLSIPSFTLSFPPCLLTPPLVLSFILPSFPFACIFPFSSVFLGSWQQGLCGTLTRCVCNTYLWISEVISLLIIFLSEFKSMVIRESTLHYALCLFLACDISYLN